MWKLRKNIGRPPLGGWKWKEGNAPLEADGKDALVKKITNYRLTNGIALGDVSGDLAQAWAENSPWTVQRAERGPSEEGLLLSSDVREWLLGLWRKPPTKLLGKKEAEPRYEKCAACPFNEKLAKDAPGMQDVERRALLLSRGLELPKKLGCCSVHGWHNRVAVLLPDAKCPEWE
jgi:hypothetical protein